MQKHIAIGVSFDEEVLRRVDGMRGRVPRSAQIDELLRHALRMDKEPNKPTESFGGSKDDRKE